jgi:hypothetical protein
MTNPFKSVSRKLFLLPLLLLPLVQGATAISAQVQSINGAIQGDVTDSAGALVPGAAIEADETDTGTAHNAVTDAAGHFDFPSLPTGHYVIKITKSGFATVLQQNITLTVGRTLSLKPSLALASTAETIVVNSSPLIDELNVSSATTLNEATIATTPVLGRKFEDLLTLTPGVSIVQGPDGDEININGQRGIFNNISLDGGDYNNGFFGEQSGGQRAAVDITLEAVKEFQVVASGANAEFGRTGGGVVNVITKSGTNTFHGSLFEYQRLQALAANTADGNSLTNFHREQFGGSAGGAIVKDKLFFFAAGEGIDENLLRSNLSKYNTSAFGPTPCGIANPVFGSNITDAQIDANGDCQRQVLINFYKTNFNDDEGTPVDHVVHNGAFFGRLDWNINSKNLAFVSYNFDYSNNPNQTFDVATYGRTANGTEGPSHISTLNGNLITTLNNHTVNEAHLAYGYETRPRSPIDPTAVPDTGIGFAPSFRFGQPFFLGPGSSENFYHIDPKDSLSYARGKHAFKFGGEFLFSHNVQVFDGFALGRYIFGDTAGFLHYATSASKGPAYGPNVQACGNSTYSTTCTGGSPLLLYLQDLGTQAGETVQQAGYSNISDSQPGLYAQDTWKATKRLTFNYGLRWDAQFFPQLIIPVSSTPYGRYVNNTAFPNFPSNGTLPNQTREFQPRFGFNLDVFGNGKTSFRGSAGIFNARQNQLTEVGAITTNGVQQESISNFSGFGNPIYPNFFTLTAAQQAAGAAGAAVTVFDKNYHNPRIYTYNVGLDQQIGGSYVAFIDATLSKGVYLTTFLDPNVGAAVLPGQVIPGTGGTVYSGNSDTACYLSGSTDTCPGVFAAGPFPNVGAITDTASRAKSLYRGITFGVRKPYSHHFQFEAEYTYSVDKDSDSNERDPFTFRYANIYNLDAEYANSDRDERHKFNAYGLGDLPFGFKANVRIQAHSAEPETDNSGSTGVGAPCSFTNSATRFVSGIDCGRNHLRKNNNFFVLDFGVARPFHFHDSKFAIIPRVEVFNTTNAANFLNPLSSPALFDFSGFLRVGVGDPRQAQLALRFEF